MTVATGGHRYVTRPEVLQLAVHRQARLSVGLPIGIQLSKNDVTVEILGVEGRHWTSVHLVFNERAKRRRRE